MSNQNEPLHRKDIRKKVKILILWRGNPISTMKTFGQLNCSLYMRERLSILEQVKNNPNNLINASNEIYGSCCHKTKFHWYYSTQRTDERTSPEKVGEIATTQTHNPTTIQASINTTENYSPGPNQNSYSYHSSYTELTRREQSNSQIINGQTNG